MTELDSFLRQFGSGKGGRRSVLGIGTRQGAQKWCRGGGDGREGPPKANSAQFTI